MSKCGNKECEHIEGTEKNGCAEYADISDCDAYMLLTADQTPRADVPLDRLVSKPITFVCRGDHCISPCHLTCKSILDPTEASELKCVFGRDDETNWKVC